MPVFTGAFSFPFSSLSNIMEPIWFSTIGPKIKEFEAAVNFALYICCPLDLEYSWLAQRSLRSLLSLVCWDVDPQMCLCNMWLITSSLCSSHDKYRNKLRFFWKRSSPYLLLCKWSNHTKRRKWNKDIKGQKIMSYRRSNFRMQKISAQFTQFLYLKILMICKHSHIQIFTHSIYHLSNLFSTICFLVCVFF